MILTAVSLTAAAQQYGVKCQLTDSTETGEPYATARLYILPDTSKVITTGVTADDGSFDASLKAPGKYRLRFSSVGKTDAVTEFTVTEQRPKATLGRVVMRDNGNLLSAVTVTAQKPIVTAEIDRLSYDMQADEDSKSKNVLEMLRKVPLVSVDGQDNIKVRGSSNFKIYKNGHPDPSLSNSNTSEVLKAIPASMIKKIEVITEPGAKYDAEGVGAILNIVMVDNSSVKGVAGSVSAGIDHLANPKAGLYLTTQIGNVVASVNYGYTHTSTKHLPSQTTNETQFTSLGQRTMQTYSVYGKSNVHYGNIDASWEIDTLNLMTLSFGGYYYNYRSCVVGSVARCGADNTPMYQYGFSIHQLADPTSYYNFSGRFDYQHKTHRKDEALTLSYMLSTERSRDNSTEEYTDVINIPVSYTARTADTHERFIEHTAQLDWTRPFAQYHKFETGLKYIYRMNNSHAAYVHHYADQSQAGGLDTDTQFEHCTQVGAAYASYTFNYGKWSARAGLRYEFSHMAASYPDGSASGFSSNLSDWVPSASVNYKFSDANSLKWAFSTRINRPGIRLLNPAIDDGVESKSYGNPGLKSVRNYSTSLTFMHIGQKFTFNIVPGLSVSDNGIASKQWVESGKTVTCPYNIVRSLWGGLSGYVQWNPFTKTSIMLNGSAGYENCKSSQLMLENGGWSVNCNGTVSQALPAGLRLQAFGGCWNGGPDDLYGRTGSMEWYGLSLQWSGTKDQRLTVSLSASNFARKYFAYENRIVKGDYTQLSRSLIQSRRIDLRISYRFGSLRASVKKTDKSIENNDVLGGSNKGGSQEGMK